MHFLEQDMMSLLMATTEHKTIRIRIIAFEIQSLSQEVYTQYHKLAAALDVLSST